MQVPHGARVYVGFCKAERFIGPPGVRSAPTCPTWTNTNKVTNTAHTHVVVGARAHSHPPGEWSVFFHKQQKNE